MAMLSFVFTVTTNLPSFLTLFKKEAVPSIFANAKVGSLQGQVLVCLVLPLVLGYCSRIEVILSFCRVVRYCQRTIFKESAPALTAQAMHLDTFSLLAKEGWTYVVDSANTCADEVKNVMAPDINQISDP